MKIKWTKELKNKLIEMINDGKRHDEISLEFETTKKSISNQCSRLKLKTKYKKEFKCKKCEKIFEDLLTNKRLFCSSSCSFSYNRLNTKHSEKTKNKIRKSLTNRKRSKETTDKITGKNNGKWVDGKSCKYYLNKKDRVNGKKKCIHCDKYNVHKKYKTLCDDCKINYYKFYRLSCKFNFDINLYKNEFNFKLIEVHGWYSPTNGNNNLNGVSKDHLYSVKDGFINKIDYEIIKHPANCQLITQNENSSKGDNSSITLEELYKKIEEWDKKYL